MFDILKSYFNKEEYYLILTPTSLYIKNYSKLIGINETEVLVDISKAIYKIKGRDLVLVKSVGRELQINGTIDTVEKI